MLKLYTYPTPNGRKILIALEELQVPYESVIVDIKNNMQFEEIFLQLNPNNKIPVLVDGTNIIWESGAILLYLAEKNGKLISSEQRKRYETIQYLFFQAANLGPNLGRYMQGYRKPKEEREDNLFNLFGNEVSRILKVFEKILSDGRQYLVQEYSIADIMHYPWMVLIPEELLKDSPHSKSWLFRMTQREAVQKGMQ